MTSAIEREASDLRTLARRLAKPWPAEERFAQWRRGRPETRGSRLSGLFPHASEPPAGPPDRVTVTSALHPGRTWMSVPDARVRPEHASGNPAGRSRQRPFVEGRARRQDPAAPHPWGRSWMSSIAGVGPVVLRFTADPQPRAAPAAPAAVRRLDRSTLGSLAARYTPRRPDGSYNRHDARRWMRAFARNAAAQASDMLEEGWPGARRLAIGALCSMIGLDDAIRLTERPRSATARVLGDIASIRPGLDWYLNQDLGMPLLEAQQTDPAALMREIQAQLPPGVRIDGVDFDPQTGRATVRYSTI